jgi:hypothetical protein
LGVVPDVWIIYVISPAASHRIESVFFSTTTNVGKFFVSVEFLHLVQRKKTDSPSEFLFVKKLATNLPKRGRLINLILIPGKGEADIDLGLRKVLIAGIHEAERSSIPTSWSCDSKELAATAVDGARVDIDETTKLDRKIDMKSEFLLDVSALIEVVPHMIEIEQSPLENLQRYRRGKGIKALLLWFFWTM